MKLLATSLFASFASLASLCLLGWLALALPACSGSSGGLGGNGSGSSSGSSTSSSGSGGWSSSSSGGGGGNTTCSPSVPCGAGGRTYQECTSVNPQTGACVAVDYKTSDGKDFTCAGCGSCASSVATQLSDYCAGIPDVDAGAGTTTCGAALTCGTSGLTYQECTTVSSGMCASSEYKLSNGTKFTCASCGDCTTAFSETMTACSGTPTTTCTTWATCGGSSLQYEECTTSVAGQCSAMYYQTSDGTMFQCAACGSCGPASSSMATYCAGQTQSTTCGSAMACGSTGVTYQSCTTNQGTACLSAYYSTSDGQMYSCNSCSDCSNALSSVTTYCSSLGGTACGTSTCSSGYLCCSCSGAQQCLSSNSGTYTCASYGCL